ncbi:endonuclease/exonuclease/phosphatase family protein [Sulfitobacter sp. MF3-043]|uniref:endonuclease/exonuclease/phosphatase family protein n=1 Tax=Sulfitobacter sediminivivens TaxID=3252902 RepID=UPI0036D9C570
MTTLGIGLLWFVGLLVLVATLIPFSKIPHGVVRGLAFPRQQLFLMALALAVLMLVVHPNAWGWFGAMTLGLLAAIQLIHTIKFTPIWSLQSVAAPAELRADTESHIRILAANIKKSNRQFDRLISLIQARDPDVVLVIEVDEGWIDALKVPLDHTFTHWVEVPKDNGYGICLMSKFPLSETDVREMITEGVPSIRTAVRLPNGSDIRLYVVHPEPPVIDHDTIGRDSEIALVGIEAEKDHLPAIVAGDLNDVAWSTTTRRFQRLSGLLDPRVGRGFYNTFSATMPWMRWPLDHLFHDPEFRLVEMARLEKIGSDHFPMWFVLALARTKAAETKPDPADANETRKTKEMIAEEQDRPREAIGSDWED